MKEKCTRICWRFLLI